MPIPRPWWGMPPWPPERTRPARHDRERVVRRGEGRRGEVPGTSTTKERVDRTVQPWGCMDGTVKAADHGAHPGHRHWPCEALRNKALSDGSSSPREGHCTAAWRSKWAIGPFHMQGNNKGTGLCSYGCSGPTEMST
jgi:hypothetical protein